MKLRFNRSSIGFYHYLGMSRSKDQKMTKIENSLLCSQFPREAGMLHYGVPPGEATGSVRGGGRGKHCGQGPLLWFLWEKRGEPE